MTTANERTHALIFLAIADATVHGRKLWPLPATVEPGPAVNARDLRQRASK